jgi:hypothetical protein
MLAQAAAHGLSLAAIVVVTVLIILGIFLVVVRMYRSPYGPELTMFPVTRKGRERVNRSYARHGWAKPFDDEGNLIPRGKRKLPNS